MQVQRTPNIYPGKRGKKLTPLTITCAGCGEDFIAWKAVEKNKKFCSHSCYTQDRKNLSTCEKCGKKFKPNNPGQKLCSNACWRTGWDEPRPCKHCGQLFKPTNMRGQVCCSRECGLAWRYAEERRLGFRLPTQTLTCESCGKAFDVNPSGVKDARRSTPRRFCSKDCAYAVRRGTCPPHILAFHQSKAPTTIEAETYEALETLGIAFEPQRHIGNALVDAYLPETRTVIECQGDFFHCNPLVYPEGPQGEIQHKTVAKDIRRFAYLRGRGFRVIELWESDIRKHGALALLKQLL